MALVAKVLDNSNAQDSEHRQAFESLMSGDLTCLVVENFVTDQLAEESIDGLEQHRSFVAHADVPGLRVLGLSHFQAVRNPEMFVRYSQLGSELEALLASICDPKPSPFQSLKSYLQQQTNSSILNLKLESELPLSPFTVRSCGEGIGIEPHQDVLSAESPRDAFACDVSTQLAANIFLASSAVGGELEIFDLNPEETGYFNLDEGPKSVPEDQLPCTSIKIAPKTGDLVLFDCTKVHIVRPNNDPRPRITLACFLANRQSDDRIYYWA